LKVSLSAPLIASASAITITSVALARPAAARSARVDRVEDERRRGQGTHDHVAGGVRRDEWCPIENSRNEFTASRGAPGTTGFDDLVEEWWRAAANRGPRRAERGRSNAPVDLIRTSVRSQCPRWGGRARVTTRAVRAQESGEDFGTLASIFVATPP
jgi:hypothetical protein